MVIYYDTKTGNVERFINKVRLMTGWECLRIPDKPPVNEEGHLVTYTTRIGCVPDSTARFLQENSRYVRTVTSSGNRNWGANFALAADKIASQYKIPLLFKFELSGLEQDVINFIQKVKDNANQKMDTPQ